MKKCFSFLILVTILSSCQKEISAEGDQTAYINIRFNPQMNGEPLALNTSYINAFNESFSLTAFKFYTGQFALSDLATGNIAINSGEPYHLADIANAGSLELTAPIAPGEYNVLSMILGVDSARNVSGVQSGALDPANGMFWTWNSGYIFMKMEGTSDVSTQPNGIFQYHNGGFRTPYSAIRLFQAILSAPDKWTIKNGQTISFDVNVEIEQFFNNSFPLKIAETPVAMTPGELAYKLADNFAASFQVTNYEIR